MPQRGRSRRAAARQTQLGQRKKRHTRVSVGEAAAVGVRPADGGAAVAARPDVPAAQVPTATRPAPSRPQEPRPVAYAYVVPELKRILVIASGAFAILIVLSVVLR